MKTGFLISTLFTACLILPGTTAADDQSHLEQVEILFKLTRMKQKINDSVDSVAQLQLRQVEKSWRRPRPRTHLAAG